MKAQKAREIVIEFERVQIVRKRSKTHFQYCDNCLRETDFIGLPMAATLFNVESESLVKFINTYFSHYKRDSSGEIYICVPSFLAGMKAKASIEKIKIIEN